MASIAKALIAPPGLAGEIVHFADAVEKLAVGMKRLERGILDPTDGADLFQMTVSEVQVEDMYAFLGFVSVACRRRPPSAHWRWSVRIGRRLATTSQGETRDPQTAMQPRRVLHVNYLAKGLMAT